MSVLKVARLGEVVEAVFVERPNRFVVEADVEGRGRVRCLNTNTGRLRDLLYPGARLLCARKQGGRTSHRLVAVTRQGGIAIVDTGLQMRVFEELVVRRAISWLEGCSLEKRAPRVGESILDYQLKCGNERVLVEVKSAVLEHGRGYAGYPDCPTDRGVRHLEELAGLSRSRSRALVVFIAAFPGARGFKPYAEGDPRVVSALERAVASGVGVRALGIEGLLDGSVLWARLYAENLPIVMP